GPEGDRDLPVTDLLLGPYTNALEPGEILREVAFPCNGLRAAYLKEGRFGPADFAIVGCCAAKRAEANVRIAFTGLSAAPHRDRESERALAESSDQREHAAALAGAGIEPLEDAFGSTDYRRHLARVLALRALNEIEA